MYIIFTSIEAIACKQLNYAGYALVQIRRFRGYEPTIRAYCRKLPSANNTVEITDLIKMVVRKYLAFGLVRYAIGSDAVDVIHFDPLLDLIEASFVDSTLDDLIRNFEKNKPSKPDTAEKQKFPSFVPELDVAKQSSTDLSDMINKLPSIPTVSQCPPSLPADTTFLSTLTELVRKL